MVTSTYPGCYFPYARKYTTVYAIFKNLFSLYLVSFFFFSFNAFGQAGDVSQIRNGPADNPTKNFFSTFPNPDWVNGNAGASNAHYREGMSIGYRSLITGVTAGVCYEYILEYDTYHGAMAIDYLTHFQRLEPHGPFNHSAEVIDPRIFKSGNKEYILGVVSTNTFTIPAPAASGIASGSTKNIAGQPTASYNALPAAEKLMTIYNGTINNITYEDQDAIAISGNTNTSSSIRISFTAEDDSVVLAWGGHIASRLDWGFSSTTGEALSAAGISGSPYHMRQISMNTCAGVNIPIGNQDRSLSAAAVFPPPECPTVPSQTKCFGSSSFVFTIASPETGTTYTWSFGSNTANAAFSGGTNTGNSVTIVPAGGGSFTAGSFTLDITALRNGISQVCPGVATGTVVQVIATASASPTLIDIRTSAHSTTLTADINASSSDPNNANYNYLWEIVTAGTAGTLTNATSRIATYTAGLLDASSTIQFKVTATQKSAPSCSDDEVVSVSVNAGPVCDVSPQAAICQGATPTHNGSPSTIFTGATYTWSLEGYGGTGTTSSTLASTNGGVSMQVNASQSYRIVLSQVYPNTALNTSCYEDVTVIPTPSVSTRYNAPSCSEKTFTVDVTNPVNNFTYSIDQPGNNLTFSNITPSAGSPNVQFTGLTNGDGFTVTVTTDVAGCTNTSSCATNPEPSSRISTTSNSTATEVTAVTNTENTNAKAVEPYRITLGSTTKVKALPNPYVDKLRFNLLSSVSGMGSLELYNVLGQKIGIVFEGYVDAGREFNKEYNVPTEKRGTLIYVFKVGDQRVTGKLIGLK